MLNCIEHNYHTHTFRCGHADGTDEQYVQFAIEAGIKTLGFSDHIMLPDHPQEGIRGNYELLDDYISSINNLKIKYKDKIDIKIGFEAEALHYYFPYYKNLLESGKIEYLILGNHLEIDENDKLHFFFSHHTKKKDVKRYAESLIKGMSTKLFACVAHPDYFMGSYKKWDSFTKRISKKIIKASIKYDIPLEINLGGVRSGPRFYGSDYRLPYPMYKFWKLAKKYKCKVILGYDSHSPLDFSSPLNKQGFLMVEELGLHIIDKLDI